MNGNNLTFEQFQKNLDEKDQRIPYVRSLIKDKLIEYLNRSGYRYDIMFEGGAFQLHSDKKYKVTIGIQSYNDLTLLLKSIIIEFWTGDGSGYACFKQELFEYEDIFSYESFIKKLDCAITISNLFQ